MPENLARIQIHSHEQIEALYADREAPIPKLDEETIVAMKGFLHAHECHMIGGSISHNPDASIGYVLGLGRSNLIDRRNDTFVGPHFLEDKYYPNAVGVWTTGNIGPIR